MKTFRAFLESNEDDFIQYFNNKYGNKQYFEITLALEKEGISDEDFRALLEIATDLVSENIEMESAYERGIENPVAEEDFENGAFDAVQKSLLFAIQKGTISKKTIDVLIHQLARSSDPEYGVAVFSGDTPHLTYPQQAMVDTFGPKILLQMPQVTDEIRKKYSHIFGSTDIGVL